MRILVDADLVLEALLNRSRFKRDAEDLWDVLQIGQFQGFISALSLSKIRAFVGEISNYQAAEEITDTIQNIMTVCPSDPAIINCARTLCFEDFETAVDVAHAESQHLSAIITNAPQNYAGANIPIYSVEDLLGERHQRSAYCSIKYQEQIRLLENLLKEGSDELTASGAFNFCKPPIFLKLLKPLSSASVSKAIEKLKEILKKPILVEKVEQTKLPKTEWIQKIVKVEELEEIKLYKMEWIQEIVEVDSCSKTILKIKNDSSSLKHQTKIKINFSDAYYQVLIAPPFTD